MEGRNALKRRGALANTYDIDARSMGFAGITVGCSIAAADGVVLSGADLWARIAGALSIELAAQVGGSAVIAPFSCRVTDAPRTSATDIDLLNTNIVLAGLSVVAVPRGCASRLACASGVGAGAGGVGVAFIIIGHLVAATDGINVLWAELRLGRAHAGLVCVTTASQKREAAELGVLAGITKASTAADCSAGALACGFNICTSGCRLACIAIGRAITTANWIVIFCAGLTSRLTHAVSGHVASIGAAQITKISERTRRGAVAGCREFLNADTVDTERAVGTICGGRACCFACGVC